MSSLLDRLLHLHGVLVYLLVAALVFAEFEAILSSSGTHLRDRHAPTFSGRSS